MPKRKRGAPFKSKRPLQYKGESEEYAIVTKFYGNGHVETRDMKGVVRMCRISGKMSGRKKRNGGRGKIHPSCWINVGDIVLLSLRDFDTMADVIVKYTTEELHKLRKEKHIEDEVTIPEEDQCGFVFGHDIEDEEEDEKPPEIDIDDI